MPWEGGFDGLKEIPFRTPALSAVSNMIEQESRQRPNVGVCCREIAGKKVGLTVKKDAAAIFQFISQTSSHGDCGLVGSKLKKNQKWEIGFEKMKKSSSTRLRAFEVCSRGY